MKKVMIAMSGGVDSSVAALLIKKNGYDCIGATMKLYANTDYCDYSSKTCCSLDDTEDARSVAYKLGMPYYVLNYTDDFSREVINRFVCAYETGRTPNPCIDCNRYMKFSKLYEQAKVLGCDYIATGHYAKVEYTDKVNGEKYPNRFLLKKALDSSKDQSYVLCFLTQEQLSHTLFPCGEMEKSEIRLLAESNSFINANKPDSQDICFVPSGNYAQFLQDYTGHAYAPGKFILRDGTVIGQHKGITHYTIGQRKGLGIAWKNPLYVCEIDVAHNRVVLGEDSDLWKKELDAADMNWIAYDTPPRSFRAKAKIRYRQEEQWANVTVTSATSIHVLFDTPQRAITKGQTIALYDDDVVLGGGYIV